MGIIELVFIGVALAMDAFAVSVCKGLSMRRMSYYKSIIVGLYFGVFQAIMPLIGYLLGGAFENTITSVDHWAAFILLSIIGLNMIKDAVSGDDSQSDDRVDIRVMLPLSIATSIDALTVGITFSFLQVNIIHAILIIGITTFLLSFLGVKIGNRFGDRYKEKAEIFGGVILILMGVKILFSHLGII